MVTREKYAEKYQLLKWNSHECNNEMFGRKIVRLKIYTGKKNPMAENLTANSQKSEILSLKKPTAVTLPEKSFCKESRQKYNIRN